MDRFVWFYHQRRSEVEVEAFARARMGDFDRLPSIVRYALNEAPDLLSPADARRLVKQSGPDEAARRILRGHW